MNQLFIKRITSPDNVTIEEAGHLLEAQAVSNFINTMNWSSFKYQPKVYFRIGHVGKEIWLK